VNLLHSSNIITLVDVDADVKRLTIDSCEGWSGVEKKERKVDVRQFYARRDNREKDKEKYEMMRAKNEKS